jgi:hypothetical protein
MWQLTAPGSEILSKYGNYFLYFQIFGERENGESSFQKKKQNMHKKIFPFHFFLSQRCENLPKRKRRQNVPHSISFCRQDVKICHKEKRRQNVPISFISVAKM